MIPHVDVYETITKGQELDKAWCTTVTLACAMDWTYQVADRYLQDYGKKRHVSCGWDGWENAIKALGIPTEKLPYNNKNKITINQFVKKYPDGTYVVGVSGHVLTIKEGTILDHSYKVRRRIFTAIKIK